MQRIKFQGQEYILTDGGAITTKEAYENGVESFAHLNVDSCIWRHGSVIGARADIEFLGEIPNVGITPEGIFNVLTGHGWPSITGKEVSNGSDKDTEI